MLDEMSNAGLTIIEKFERVAREVAYAIAIMTVDDSEVPKDQELSRQNLIFELGYLIGRLGRDKVCLLYKGNISIPTELHDVLLIPIDGAADWHSQLARAMRAAKLNIVYP
jgi:predicted nucleotide-binding protein